VELDCGYECVYIRKMLELRKERVGEAIVMESLTISDRIFDGIKFIHKYDATYENYYL
jgi:hypothetical protein